MPNSNSFDRLIQKALATQDYPPIPSAILQKWQPARSEKGVAWLWILPSMVFVIGVSVGVWLAPMGLGNAFVSMKMSLSNLWNSIPDSTLTWGLALAIAIVVLTFDGLRSALMRFR
jgi:hypothetical protein